MVRPINITKSGELPQPVAPTLHPSRDMASMRTEIQLRGPIEQVSTYLFKF